MGRPLYAIRSVEATEDVPVSVSGKSDLIAADRLFRRSHRHSNYGTVGLRRKRSVPLAYPKPADRDGALT